MQKITRWKSDAVFIDGIFCVGQTYVAEDNTRKGELKQYRIYSRLPRVTMLTNLIDYFEGYPSLAGRYVHPVPGAEDKENLLD